MEIKVLIIFSLLSSVCCQKMNDTSDDDRKDDKSKISSLKSPLPEICGNKTSMKYRIAGGKIALPGSWPWIVAIFINGIGHDCGGTLITDQHVITAAHCVMDNGKVQNSSEFMVGMGKHNITAKSNNEREEDFLVSEIVAHEEYDEKTLKNDIAIMKLNKKVKFDRRIFPICLPFKKNLTETVSSAQIAGWGRLEYRGNSSDVLQEGKVFIIPQDKCLHEWEDFGEITDGHMCAGTVDSTVDSCKGDSGGPLMQKDPKENRFYLTGIISFGYKCATPGFPGVYTRVSKYMDWILNHL